MARTAYAACPACEARIIWAARGTTRIPLDWQPDPQGLLAASCDHLGRWKARPETPGVPLIFPEKRFACHWDTSPQCRRDGAETPQDGGGTAAWQAARAAQGKAARRRRGRRDKPVTGVRWGGAR